ncbi:hypothetical protein ONZ43_g3968 [Nemania bipapillata]|uniref:Uncharacterized protein n=1 Tax=Nemania bipapillata TaxID=110536 RepID=A0ACC2ITM6_9PEZI|nr:hypothetical protein ONZ43_g3968 [Nemania bipapillata]
MNRTNFTSMWPSNLGLTYEIYASNSMTLNQTYWGSDDGTFWSRWGDTQDDRKGWSDRIAKSLSNLIRSTNKPNGTADVYAGKAFIQEPYIHVAWPWIAYPVTVLIITIGLLIRSIMKTLKSTEDFGNQGALALLMADIDLPIKELAKEHSESMQEFKEVIGNMNVRLDEGHFGPYFRSA